MGLGCPLVEMPWLRVALHCLGQSPVSGFRREGRVAVWGRAEFTGDPRAARPVAIGDRPASGARALLEEHETLLPNSCFPQLWRAKGSVLATKQAQLPFVLGW